MTQLEHVGKGLELSDNAHINLQEYMEMVDLLYIPYDVAFNILDEMYGLIPQQDLGDGTYQWVCDYSGGKFYALVGAEDSVWIQDGI